MENGMAPETGGIAPELATELEELDLLRAIRDGVSANTPTLALTDESVPPLLNADFPAPGMSRLVVPRKASGGVIPVPSIAAANLILAANSNRAALTIVNMGQADCLLPLAPEADAGSAIAGAIFLVAHGGSWDGRLGPPLWCGSISAIALATESGEEVLEETELAVVEV
jgi:hypothetical protein